ncbi:hypothetical protein CYY_007387 [Polysphondylium violaceum]|uniref:TLDc domain-containing protein n=1 Tax=Polysphondylium violaceum TaxID=133409 RepID=A0A8J4PPA7_9MYCE|nr:hypothetical protein CYY_007387 [Polysphondylium violaceum]
MYSSNNNISDIVENNKRKNKEQSIEGVESLFLGHFETLQQQIKDLEKRKEVLLNVTKVIDVSVIPDPITLNIGGFKHQTTKSTLTKIPNSFFDLMLSGEIDIKPMTNKPNTYFIDRDGTHFNYILNYLRDEGDIQIPEDIRHCIRKEMEFYRINEHFKLDDNVTIIDKLNSLKQELDETKQAFYEMDQELAFTKEESKKKTKNLKQEVNSLKDKLIDQFNNSILPFSLILNHHTFNIINDWIDESYLTNFELLYHTSKTNKFNAQAFHSACDGEGATITVIETTDGCVFGGYNSQSWNSGGYFYGDNKCFIFTLVNKHGIPPTKYIPKENEKNFVAGHKNFGPWFGNLDGSDFQIQAQYGSYQQFPAVFDTTGKGKTTLSSTKFSVIKSMEIYKCS